MSNQVTKTIIVKGDVASIYSLWADFENFPHFMKHIKKVTKTGERTSHWTMEVPMAPDVSWDAEITRMEENQRIAWSTKQESDITTSGQVTFTAMPNNQTEVTVVMQYSVPGGVVGEAIAKLLTNPEARLAEDLRNFKTYAEKQVKAEEA